MKKVLINLKRINEFSAELKIIYVYRYISLLITSIFYLLQVPSNSLVYKIGVIVPLFISAIILINTYNKYYKAKNVIKLIIIVETIGISLLLIPTGGLDSPFIWYALNPVLVAAYLLSKCFCWINLMIYLTISTLTSYHIFSSDKTTVTSIILNNSHLILIFILITLAVQLLARLAKELTREKSKLIEINKQLETANTKSKEAMNHIMSLYKAIEAFSSKDNKNELIESFVFYIQKITKSSLSFYWSDKHGKNKEVFKYCGDIVDEDKLLLEKRIKSIWINEEHNDTIIQFNLQGYMYLLSFVKSTSRRYGITGIRVKKDSIESEKNIYINRLSFLSDLISVILERFRFEDELIDLNIIEEQNRIAEEMHDSVSQRLFSISCAIHAMTKKYELLSKKQVFDQLSVVKESASTATKELRATIYGLSTRKKGDNIYISNIKKYLNSVSRLNNIEIKFNVNGDEHLLSGKAKKFIYRIISESSGNAIRHGKCSLLEIYLEITNNKTLLRVKDDGKGFNSNLLNNDEKIGLGFKNMKSLVRLLNGKWKIETSINKGTIINICIPNNQDIINKGDVVV